MKRQTKMQRKLSQKLVFAIVETKLVWYRYDQKIVWHFDLENYANIEPGKLEW